MSENSNPSTNLPEQTHTGTLTVKSSIIIDAPIERVWDVLTDFPKYGEWNPFVRSQVIVDKAQKRVEDQTPAVGKHLLMQTHIPPTMDDSASKTPAFELITHWDEKTRRVAWKYAGAPFVKAERWQALSTTEDGKTLYETREVFGGIGAYLIRLFLSAKLQQGFDGMSNALKARCESK